jgi:hypothetical protein
MTREVFRGGAADFSQCFVRVGHVLGLERGTRGIGLSIQLQRSRSKREILFLAQTEPYDKRDAFDRLVQRVEALLSKENTDWAQSMMKPPKGEKRV